MQVIHMHETKNATSNTQERMYGQYPRHGGQRGPNQNKGNYRGYDQRNQGGMPRDQNQQQTNMTGGMPMPNQNMPMPQQPGMGGNNNFKNQGGMPQSHQPMPPQAQMQQMQQNMGMPMAPQQNAGQHGI